VHVALNGLWAEEAELADALVGVSLGHEREDFAFAGRELVEWSGFARAVEESADDRRIEDALAVPEATQGIAEDSGVADALLEEVTGATGMVLEQRRCVADIEVTREQEHRGRRVALADLGGRPQPLVGVRGRHLDVHQRGVWTGALHEAQQAIGVLGPPTTSKPRSARSRPIPARRRAMSSAITTRMARSP
jgi:hypothetical protein